MWRKRSIKRRYWEVLKRFRLGPGIAGFALVGSPPHWPNLKLLAEGDSS
ncbi:MAG TPA: hypothetical protein VGC79_10115 [Polyangiaceae bacterium]